MGKPSTCGMRTLTSYNITTVVVTCVTVALLLFLFSQGDRPAVLVGTRFGSQHNILSNEYDSKNLVVDAALQRHLDLVKSCQGPPLPNCSHAQLAGLRNALQYGLDHAPDVWQTWDTAQRVQRPEYGAWRFAEPATLADTGAAGSRKWIIMTSITGPSEQVKQWAAMEGWEVLVVADLRTPVDWSWPNVTLLSVQQQKKMPLRTARLLPYNNYARKAFGYLYAIAHGADIIYETDDDNGPKPGVGLSWIMPEQAQGVRVTKEWSGAQNPYAHFGECNIWPRGFPLDTILQEGLQACQPLQGGSMEPSAKGVFAPVQQGLADLDPDVDAIWRLANKERIGVVHFQEAAPLAFQQGTISPYNTQNTAHYRSAFWAMYIPSGVNMRVCDIWRGYWAQRLLWEIGGSVVFTGGTVEQVRNPHIYEVDFKDEFQMYIQSSSLVDYLMAWMCPYNHIYDCMLKLTWDMAQEGYWPPSEVEMMTAWIHDLAAIGYKPPNLTTPMASHQHAKQRQAELKAAAIMPTPLQGKQLSSLSIFLAMTSKFEAEFRQQFLASFMLFYPLSGAHLTIVMDEEVQMDHQFAARLSPELASVGVANDIKFAQPDPITYHNQGHDRQQLLMFWADNFTKTEYVGFADTDTVFVTQVTEADLFDDLGRPRIIGFVGKPQNSFWKKVPSRTQFILQQEEVLRCMAYFPIVIKTKHLQELRAHVAKLHSKPFDKVFQEVSRYDGSKGYSQFNIMCNYLWHFHRDEYHFHLQALDPDWSGSVPGQIPATDLKALLANESLTHPVARIAVHWTYHSRKGHTPEWGFADALLQGACLSANKVLDSYLCKGYDRSHVQDNLFEFSRNSWVWDSRVGIAQATHYTNVDSLRGNLKQWNVTLLQQLRKVVDSNKKSITRKLLPPT